MVRFGICIVFVLALSVNASAQAPGEQPGRQPDTVLPPQATAPPPTKPSAAKPTDYAVCINENASFRNRMAACERAILAADTLKASERATAYDFRAQGHKARGHYDQAIADYTEALKFEESRAERLNNRAIAYQDKGELELAIADYTEALKVDPKYSWAYNNRGNVFLDKGEFDRAIADYDEALKVTRFAKAYINRGRALAAKKDFVRALTDLDTALRINPKSVVGLNVRCRVLTAMAEFDRALADCGASLALDPRSVDAISNRGDAYLGKGDLNAALLDYDKVLELNPNFVRGYIGRAQLFEKRGDLNRARADYRSAAFALTRYDDIETQRARILARERLSALGKAQAPATSGRRIALVVGNGGYKNVSALPNPTRDANMIAATLRGVGFQTVTVAHDLTRDKFFETLRAFAREAETADWALIYYAGHGLEIGGVNYLVPVDARLKSDRDAAAEAVALEQVIASVQGARKLRLVMLDACRDNPFAPQMQRTIALRLVTKGLSNIEPDTGFMVVYAAKHGETALDGAGANSPFATAVARSIKSPGIEVRKLFDIVRDDVGALTNKKQQPFSYGSLPGREDFFFVAGK